MSQESQLEKSIGPAPSAITCVVCLYDKSPNGSEFCDACGAPLALHEQLITASPLALGQNLGKYRIINQLGSGGEFNTYKAYDPEHDRYVAIYVMRQELQKDPKSVSRFKEGIESAKILNHPNIAGKILDFEISNNIYSVTNYLVGKGLDQYIDNNAPLPLDNISNILNQVSSALDHIHKQGILHCYVTPWNILIEPSGKVYLIDFGGSVNILNPSESSGGSHGQPGYAPLEMIATSRLDHLTAASDVYSLAVTLYEMVTGKHPFQARDQQVSFMKQLNDPLPLPHNLRPDLPESAEQVILKGLSRNPKARYQTAGAMANAFAKAISNCKPSQNTLINQSKVLINNKQFNSMVSILFLAADPTNASRLRLGEELREIQEKLQLSKLREQFQLNQRMSVRPADISQALLDIQPQVVHFSGHGTSTGALCFENQVGDTHPIQPDALAALFEQFADQVSCVVLNACYSEVQATAIAEHIDYVIGMNQEIGDRAAVSFSVGFYQALGAGRSIEKAYKLGCVQIRLQNIPEHLTPILLKKEEVH